MAAMDGAAFTKQGELKTLGGFSNSEWQTRSVALKSGQPPMLLFSQASSTFGSSASSSDVDGCITLSPSSAAAATPGTSTDFTLTNVEHAHNAVLGLQSLDLNKCDEITDNSVNYLAQLKSLKRLDLEVCRKITFKGQAHLAKLSGQLLESRSYLIRIRH